MHLPGDRVLRKTVIVIHSLRQTKTITTTQRSIKIQNKKRKKETNHIVSRNSKYKNTRPQIKKLKKVEKSETISGLLQIQIQIISLRTQLIRLAGAFISSGQKTKLNHNLLLTQKSKTFYTKESYRFFLHRQNDACMFLILAE